MTAYQFSQPWLSQLNGEKEMNALEWAHLRDYLKGVDNGTISLFNPNFINFQINGTSLSLPVSVANGGTNSTTALANGVLMVSSGGKIVEIAADTSVGSHKLTSLTNGTAAQDAAAFGQIKFIQAVQTATSTQTSTTSSTFQAFSNLAVSITPTSASNRIKISVSTVGDTQNVASQCQVTVKRGSTELAGGAGGFAQTGGPANRYETIAFHYIDSPATTSATTYTVYFSSVDNANTVDIGRNDTKSVIIVEEIV